MKSWCLLSAVALGGALASDCQKALDDYCNDPAHCLAEVGGRFHGPLHARYDGPGSPEWRCYAEKDLDQNLTHYVEGTDYCTRNEDLTQINNQSPCNGTLPPAPVDPGLNSTLVFTTGLAGIACYRIPAIVQTHDNSTLIAFAEARHGSCSDGAVYV